MNTLGEYITQLNKEAEERYKKNVAPMLNLIDSLAKAKKLERVEVGQLKALYSNYGTPTGIDLTDPNIDKTLKEKRKDILEKWGSIENYANAYAINTKKNMLSNQQPQSNINTEYGANNGYAQVSENVRYKDEVNKKLSTLPSDERKNIISKFGNDLYSPQKKAELDNAINDTKMQYNANIKEATKKSELLGKLTIDENNKAVRLAKKMGIKNLNKASSYIVAQIVNTVMKGDKYSEKSLISKSKILMKMSDPEINWIKENYPDLDIETISPERLSQVHNTYLVKEGKLSAGQRKTKIKYYNVDKFITDKIIPDITVMYKDGTKKTIQGSIVYKKRKINLSKSNIIPHTNTSGDITKFDIIDSKGKTYTIRNKKVMSKIMDYLSVKNEMANFGSAKGDIENVNLTEGNLEILSKAPNSLIKKIADKHSLSLTNLKKENLVDIAKVLDKDDVEKVLLNTPEIQRILVKFAKKEKLNSKELDEYMVIEKIARTYDININNMINKRNKKINQTTNIIKPYVRVLKQMPEMIYKDMQKKYKTEDIDDLIKKINDKDIVEMLKSKSVKDAFVSSVTKDDLSEEEAKIMGFIVDLLESMGVKGKELDNFINDYILGDKKIVLKKQKKQEVD